MGYIGAMVTLRDLVLESGLRQTWIAEKMHVNHTLLNHWLAGRRKMPEGQVVPFADALRIDRDMVAEARTAGLNE